MYSTEQENKNKNKTHVKRERTREINDASSPKPLFIDRGDRTLRIYTHAYLFFRKPYNNTHTSPASTATALSILKMLANNNNYPLFLRDLRPL